MKFEKHFKHLPLSLFGLYFLKVTIFAISYPESAVLAVLGLVACYFQSKNNDEKLTKLEEKIIASNKILEEKLATANKNFENRVNEVEGIKSQLNAIKVNGIFKPLEQRNVR